MYFPQDMNFQYFFFSTYPGYFLQAFPLLIVFQVALAFQLGAHFVQGLLAGGSLHLIQNIGKVFDLILALEQQLFQHLAGGLLLFIIAEVFLDLTDDTELVAVISAAIAASEGTTTEGFVVRSINRR